MSDRNTDTSSPALTSADALIHGMATQARLAAAMLAMMPTNLRADALRQAARAIRLHLPAILAANAQDMADAEARGLSSAMLDRLRLTADRIDATADAVADIAALPDPVGTIIDRTQRPNGLILERQRIPIGVIGIIYESRPNVTADAAALCVMSGNAVILRGGSEAARSNLALFRAMQDGIQQAGIPPNAVQLLPTQDRDAVGAMLRAQGMIDLVIPRGGKNLVARIQNEARVPVLAHLDGICHTYVDGDADPVMAEQIVVNAKLRRTGVCGATETLLIDRAFDEPGPIIRALLDAACTVRGDAAMFAVDPRVQSANDQDWDTEYLDAIVAARFVDGVDGALDHIARHSSHHTDAIVTNNSATAERFLRQTDSAIVMWNASTQFADGGEFGLGAEIGISTGRLHARGPVALEGLTTYKWIVRGTGQVRP